MTERTAWFCPSCQRHHAPHVETCPAPVDAISTNEIAPFGPYPSTFAPRPYYPLPGAPADSSGRYLTGVTSGKPNTNFWGPQ